MNNKGFTLIEVTAVVMLMALILLLVLPNVLSVRENTNEKISNNVKQILFSDAEEYVRNKGYDIKPGNIYCIPVNTLINEGATSVEATEYRSYIIKVSIESEAVFNKSMPKTCTEVAN